MAAIDLTPTTLTIRFTRGEKIGGLLRDLEVPLADVRSVTVEPDGLQAARGVRAPGLAIPGVRKLGTWRARGHRSAVCVRRGQPALRIALDGHKYSELLVGAANAEELATQLRATISDS